MSLQLAAPRKRCPAVPARRRGRPSKLAALMRDTPERYAKMLDAIRGGAFSWVAAQSIGVAPETFSRWMSKGAEQRQGDYRQFRQDVLRAAAQSRAIAEIRVYRENPLAWLRYGPGRTTQGCPGWTDNPCDAAPAAAPRLPAPANCQPPVADATTPNLFDVMLALEQAGYVSILPLGRATFDTSDDEASESATPTESGLSVAAC